MDRASKIIFIISNLTIACLVVTVGMLTFIPHVIIQSGNTVTWIAVNNQPCAPDYICKVGWTVRPEYPKPVFIAHRTKAGQWIASLKVGDKILYNGKYYEITEHHFLSTITDAEPMYERMDFGITDYIDRTDGKYMDFTMIEGNWLSVNDMTLSTCIIDKDWNSVGRVFVFAKLIR
jgi:hypothetical protein